MKSYNRTMMYATLSEKVVCSPNEWTEYLRVDLAVETGYGLKIIRTNVFDNELKEKCKTIELFSKVQFTGYYAMKANYFRLISLDLIEFDECEKCLAPLEEPCPGCLKKPAEKIYGEWQVTDIKTINKNRKITFTQNNNILCYYFFSNSLFYNICSSLQVTDMVKIEGWREYENRYSYFKKIEKIGL